MTRKDFIKRCAAIGMVTPFFASMVSACAADDVFIAPFDVNFDGRVLVIGAGAAGLTAGHALKQHNIDFTILEASGRYGGRVKEITDFADVPIDLGAEWIHTDPSILATLLNDRSVNAEIDIITYRPEKISIWTNGKLRRRNFFSNFYSEYKFKNTTWFSFFDRYIVPGIRDRLVLNSPVQEIDYTSSTVRVTTSGGEVYEADKVIVTVPLTMLQNDSITFRPAFPTEKRQALDEVPMPDGIKVFMEFSERFYPDMLMFEGVLEALDSASGERVYYDAAFRKESQANLLGLFAVGEPATVYATMETEEELMEYILNELDEIFDGKASRYYRKHVTQNWSKEPYIQGSYSHYPNYDSHDVIQAPLDNKVFFAGEAYAESDATVHGAGESAYVAVEAIVSG